MTDPTKGANLTGKHVVAHPSRVAEADQLAATEQAGVILKTFCPTTHLYVFDFDQLCALPEDFRVRL